MAGLNNDVWVEFFEEYRNCPELWNSKSNIYKNKNKKNKALLKLLQIYNKVDEKATIAILKNKIHNIRTCYRRELKKVVDSEKSGAGAEDLYTPSLWYFEILNFLRYNYIPRPCTSTLDSDNEAEQIEILDFQPKVKKKSINNQKEEFVKNAVKHLNDLKKVRDDTDIFAEEWALSFRKLSENQKFFAKKAIDEILILGQLNQLSANFVPSSPIPIHENSPFSLSRSGTPITSSSSVLPSYQVEHLSESHQQKLNFTNNLLVADSETFSNYNGTENCNTLLSIKTEKLYINTTIESENEDIDLLLNLSQNTDNIKIEKKNEKTINGIKSKPKPKICPICGDLKSSSTNLKFHMNVHLGLKPFGCKICEAKFAHKTNLISHEKIHEGNPKHKCNYCDKLFYNPSARKLHERYHTGERPSICDICGKTYSNTGEMNQHREVHDEIPKYKCDLCNKFFKIKKSLREHKVLHDPKEMFKCTFCDKEFPLKRRLRNHLKIHSDVKQYECKLCEKRFAQGSGLYCHLKSSHKIDRAKTTLNAIK